MFQSALAWVRVDKRGREGGDERMMNPPPAAWAFARSCSIVKGFLYVEANLALSERKVWMVGSTCAMVYAFFGEVLGFEMRFIWIGSTMVERGATSRGGGFYIDRSASEARVTNGLCILLSKQM